jgi:hypothetical protein
VNTRIPVRRAYAAIALMGMTMLASCAKKETAQTVDTTTTALAVDTTARPRAMAQPDAQMQAVLDQFQQLGPKPLPTLTAA